jgi:hypothetical protein
MTEVGRVARVFLTSVLEGECSQLHAPATSYYGNSLFYRPYVSYTYLDRDLISRW